MPKFHGGNSGDLVGLPSGEHPRSTGALLGLDVDPAGAEVLYAATFRQGLMRSTDDGASWAPVLSSSSPGLHFTIGGPAGPTWWLSRPHPQGEPAMMPGRSAYVAAQVAVDPQSPEHV